MIRSKHRLRSAGIIFLWTAAVVFLDQLTKWLAVHYLAPKGSVPIIPQVFHLSYVENSGIAFGLFHGHGAILAVIISVSVLALVAYAFYIAGRPMPERTAYAFILGGAIGNLYDRLRFHHVIDFLDFRVWPVFNLADSFITLGVAYFVWAALFRRSSCSPR